MVKGVKVSPEQFCYWLRGILEIQTAGLDNNCKFVPKLTESQIMMIDDHLKSVFDNRVMQQTTVTPTPMQSPSELLVPDLRQTTFIC